MKKINKKKTNWGMVIFWTMIYLAFVFVGFIIGMTYQQKLTTVLVTEVLAYSNVEVNIDLNETKIIEGFKEVTEDFVEQMNITSYNTTKEKLK